MSRLMSECGRRAPWWRHAAGLALLGAATLLAQELPEIREMVDVRVVNVDVVVSDAEGRPVRGLTRDDFELLVDGRRVALDYFSAVAGGSQVESPAERQGMAALPYLAIVYDGRGARPPDARSAAEAVAARLDGLLASTRAVMVLRQGTSLVVEQPMTRDRLRLSAALARLAAPRSPALDAADRKMLLLQLESPDPPRITRESEDELIADRARRLLGQIHLQAEAERFAAEESARQLRSVVRSLGGLSGRKAILLLGQGLRREPAAPLFRLWWSKYSRHAPRIGVFNIEFEMGRARDDQLFSRLADEAKAQRVTFYSHDPAGLRVVGSSAEYASLEANLQLARETEQELDSLVDLAVATGGVGRVRASSIEPLLDEMLNGFGTYYSLGFAPGDRSSGRVEVRLRQPGLRLRYLEQFTVRTAAQELEDATLATLLTAAEDNRLGVAVELGEAERQPDGTFLVPLLIKVPMSRLSLLPRRALHIGRLSFVIVAQAADGGLSRPATGNVPIEIANSELLSAVGRLAGYRLQLRLAAGEQIVAIGVRDEVARQDATVRLVLTLDRDA
jgi:VWFA-related protein